MVMETNVRDIQAASRPRYSQAVLWGVFLSLVIVGATAILGRAAANLSAAATQNPELYLHMELNRRSIEYDRSTVEYLGSPNNINETRAYFVETDAGFQRMLMKYINGRWVLDDVSSPLHINQAE